MASKKDEKRGEEPKREELKTDLASFFKLGTVAPKKYDKVVAPEDNDGYVLPKGVVESGTTTKEISERMNRKKIKSAYARLAELKEKKRSRDEVDDTEEEKYEKLQGVKRAKLREREDSGKSGSDGGKSGSSKLSKLSKRDAKRNAKDSGDSDDSDDSGSDSDVSDLSDPDSDDLEQMDISEAPARDLSEIPESEMTEEEKKALKKRLSRQASRHRKAEAKAAAKAALLTSDGQLEKPKKKKLTESEKEEIDARTLFIGNVPINADKKALKKIFDQYGKVESIRFRNMTVSNPEKRLKSVINKDFHPERDSMVAYVVFDSEACIGPAIKGSNGIEFGGKHLRLDSAQKGEISVRDYMNCIFISKLPFGAEEEDLREIFQRCGTIASIRIIRDKQYKVAKGFGYVRFSNSDGLKAALKLNNKITYKDSVLLIAKALPPQQSAPSVPMSSKQSSRPSSLAQKYKAKSKKFAATKRR